MGFVNQMGKLITDSRENIYNFTWAEEKISFTYHDKTVGDPETTVIVEEAMLEYDVTIDSKDLVYLICQKKDGSLLLLTYANNSWQASVLAEELPYEILNLNIAIVEDKIHIIYCSQSKNNPNIYIIYHHYLEDSQWKTIEVKGISKGDILNPISLLRYRDNLAIVYYDRVKRSDEIFIKIYDDVKEQWREDIQLTSNEEYKLYIDSLIIDDTIHLCYSQLSEGNLVIKYEKYSLYEGGSEKIEEHIISNLSNCSHPTLVFENSKLWIAWVEYDNLMSRFSENLGSSWSTPYLWKETKTKDFVRYKFFTNNEYLKEIYNFSYSFGNMYPNIGFIGFGPLHEVIEAPLKTDKGHDRITPQRINNDILDFADLEEEYSTSIHREKKDVEEEKKKGATPIGKETDNLKEYMERLDKRLSILEEESKKSKELVEKILDIEGRVDDIENYLRRRRGGIFGPR